MVTGTTGADGLTGAYYTGSDFGTLVTTRRDPAIDFNWGTGTAPAVGVGVDGFSVRWTGAVRGPVSGPVTFTVTSDDGARVWVDQTLLIDHWTDHAATAKSGTIQMVAGRWSPLTVEYYERAGIASVTLAWAWAGQPSSLVPQTALASQGPPTPWVSGQMATATVTVTGGAWPVHFVSLDLLGDAQPAWYFLMGEARGTWAYPVGPLVGNGPRQLVVLVRDERGCEASLTVPVTIQVP